MSMWNENAVVAIAALLSAGALFPDVWQARPPQAFTEMHDFQSAQAGIMPSARHGLLMAAADRDDWTAWGGALRGSPALRHSDRGHHDQAEKPRRQRSDFEQS
jgi:hypothetical protein